MPPLLLLDHLWFILLDLPWCPGPQRLPAEQLTPQSVASGPHGGAGYLVLCWLALWTWQRTSSGWALRAGLWLPCRLLHSKHWPVGINECWWNWQCSESIKKGEERILQVHLSLPPGTPCEYQGSSDHPLTYPQRCIAKSSFLFTEHLLCARHFGHWGWPTVTCPVKSKDKDGPQPLTPYLILTPEPQTPDHQRWNSWFC